MPKKRKKNCSGWNSDACDELIPQLAAVRNAMLSFEEASADTLKSVNRRYAESARNFAHYLALRRFDLRELQERLARIGVSSLGRAESHVLSNLDKVLGILHRLSGRRWKSHAADEPVGMKDSNALLESHTSDLLGAPPQDRAVRIMVTLPSEAADDFGLVKKLMQAGMDVARINCAHDGPDEWRAMAALVRRAAKSVNKPVKILMDLGGPKLRTADIEPGPQLLKVRPVRDIRGRVIEPARIMLHAEGDSPSPRGAGHELVVDAKWTSGLEAGDKIGFIDARGKTRKFKVVEILPGGVLAECRKTAYIEPETIFIRPHHRGGKRRCRPGNIPRLPAVIRLNRGDQLRLTSDQTPSKSSDGGEKGKKRSYSIGCTLPEIFSQVRKGERVWFDDGRIGAVVDRATSEWIDVQITDAREGGEKLSGDKGINLPDSQLDLPALTAKDVEDVAVVAEVADIVGLSFVQSSDDVIALRKRLSELGSPHLRIVLKIETRRAFEHLPDLLFAAMANRASGIMIARGDLAVECGYERLAEVQEEILWACEAAHMPVIWATQVLETLAKTGRPSRAEVTDAAMGERSECVMLNKGPFILDAMRTLDDILKRMQAHQSKKRPLLRALRAWNPTLP